MSLLARIRGLRGLRPSEPETRDVARSIAIIMDGNGRWASRRGLSIAEGHRAGSRALRPVVETAIDLGVESLAVYAFSTENWARPPDEVESIIELLDETIDRELPDLANQLESVFVGHHEIADDDVGRLEVEIGNLRHR